MQIDLEVVVSVFSVRVKGGVGGGLWRYFIQLLLPSQLLLY